MIILTGILKIRLEKNFEINHQIINKFINTLLYSNIFS